MPGLSGGRVVTQSPRAYDLQNLTAAQLAVRLAANAGATQRGNLRTAWQDGGLRYKIAAAETAAGLVDANLTFGFDPGDARRYGVVGDGVTDDSTALQRCFTASAGAPWWAYIPNFGNFIKLTTRITAPAGLRIGMERGSILEWTATTATGTNWLGVATRPGIEILGDDFWIEGRGQLIGPSVASYVANECALLRVGASRSARGFGVVVRDVEITQWGSQGIALQFVENIEVLDTRIHHLGYQGCVFLSCQDGKVQKNRLHHITPGTATNMYGVSCSHDSTNYSSDPNASSAPRQTTNPFCIGFDVSANTVYSINWLGLDAHGAYECNYHHNNVYDCYIGIQIASSSGAGINYAGEANSINYNNIRTSQMDGSATTVSGHSGLQFGITVNGGSTLSHRGVRVIGNDIQGCGDTSGAGGSAYSIQASLVQGAIIKGNTIRDWYSVGIYGNHFDGQISDNTFNAPANATTTKCIWQDSNSLRCIISGNALETHGGNTPGEGIRTTSSGSVRVTVSGNEMSQATTPYSGDSALFTAGPSDVVPRIQDATTGAHTLDLGALGPATEIFVEYAGAGVANITDILNVRVGCQVIIKNGSASALTLTSGTPFKFSAASPVINQNGSFGLLCISTANPKFVEISRSLTNAS